MRKYQRAAVVAAMLGSVSFLGTGVSHAGGGMDCSQNDSLQGLIQVEHLPINLALIGNANQNASEPRGQHCGMGH